MFGIDDPWIWSGYLFAILLTAFTILYGWMQHNKEEE
jgi:hypothetical protein